MTSYLDEIVQNATRSRIPTGIVLSGPGSASSNSLARRVADAVQKQKRRIYVPLDSGSAPHLKAVLKTLIQKATAITVEEDEDDELALTSRKGPRLLNYDLQILYEHVRDRKIEQVVVSFPDTEALTSSLLSELIELMSSWLDRIPFVCLFNVATSVEFLQQRLSRSAVRCLDGRLFDAAPSSAETQLVFSAITHPDARLWLGPTLLASALERQSDYIQSVDELVDVVEYAYMSSYYANALSIFLDPAIKLKTIPDDHFEALRNLPSFRTWVQTILAEGDAARVHKLLESDEDLLIEAKQEIQQGKESLCKLTTTLDVIRAIQECLPNMPTSPKSSLFIQAMSCKLRGSAMIRTLLLSVRKAQSDMASALMEAVLAETSPETFKSDVHILKTQLAELVTSNTSSKSQPLRSEDDIGSSTVRTTVVAQKVHLSKQKSQLSKQDAAYTEILRAFSDNLEAHFNATLIDPQDLSFHEVFIYDLKSPHREVFTPRPRHAIERALGSPHDYLDCDCCAPANGGGDEEEATLSSTQPAAAMLYQLYLESGSLINVGDLWQAFQAVMGGEKEREEGELMALFQRGLAELRYLGLVKSTRKRADHVAKVAWRGL